MSLFDKQKENVSLLININNGSINTALVSFRPGQVPKFLYSVETQFIGVEPDAMKLPDGVSSLLESSLKEITSKGWAKIGLKNKKISHVMVSFSSPWLILKTKDIHLSQDHLFIITKKFINDIAKKEEDLFKKELSEVYSGGSSQQFNTIEKSVIQTKINGYAVEDILGKKTKDFDVSILLSAVSKGIEEKIAGLIFKETHIPKENLIVNSFPMVLFSTARDNFSTDSNFMLLNVDGETTDAILVEDHALTSIVSFPFGKNTIIRSMAKLFKTSSKIAESNLMMYLSNKIDATNVKSIESLLEKLEKEWAVYFGKALLGLSPNMTWPKKTLIMADKYVSQIFIDFLSLQKEDATSSFRKHAEVKLVDETLLSNLYLKTPEKEIGNSLIILAVFYNKLLHI
ncbi:MAG: hypothetical protein QG579_333 [Patescibacteria group bacterium]|jgi:hypothetical protein|nr:hypothetical protein [Patescibacteria group bacterium]